MDTAKTITISGGNPEFRNCTFNSYSGPPTLSSTKQSSVRASNVDLGSSNRGHVVARNNSRLTEEYKIQSNPKGRALIINNEVYEYSSGRTGSSKDVKDMENLWKNFGCDVQIETNLSAARVEEAVEKYSKGGDRIDFHVLIIMSHGAQDDLVVGIDGRMIKVKHLVDYMAKSDQMKGKPKLIFFQINRGTRVQTDAFGADDDESSWIKNKFGSNGMSNEVKTTAFEYISQTEDILLAFATQPGHVSFRHPIDGCWFIQCIKEVFTEYHSGHDVIWLMDKVQELMQRKKVDEPGSPYHKCKAEIDYDHTFTKVLQLSPNH